MAEKGLPTPGYPGLLRMVARISGNLSCSKPPPPQNEESIIKNLDDCDDALIVLLNERAKAIEQLWSVRGPEEGIPSAALSAPTLERLRKTNEMVNGPLPDSAIRGIFQEVSKVCARLRHSVAYLGPPATFSHQAARSRFGVNSCYEQCDRISDIFYHVEKGTTDYGVAPVENSTEGAISQTLDLLANSDDVIEVVAEVCLDIQHNLLSRADISRIQRVYSHPQALAQCRQWLQTHVPGATINSEASTARAAQIASEALPEEGIAAVSSTLASELYDIPIRAAGIQDLTSNMTRFVVIRKNNPENPEQISTTPTGDDKTMLVLSTADRVGALHDVLNTLQQQSINLSRIESRPCRSKAWEYIFFVDLHGHRKEPHIAAALETLKSHCSHIRVLGSFPFVRTAQAIKTA
eukprot:CAMPEP_0181305648 /NCGR_PEP_ID=MMETSP1101-20121128/9850_1 /TAXON_ID=46948 /ORGANISM="Rhodomonas abbreviata, Strain Caron Lab Isolate" /LENGTH=407 /DNA_ID=CAMNT_0023411595 /DNA_START=23 /DNA_END=1246 /DNA_ORIENTATION=+